MTKWHPYPPEARDPDNAVQPWEPGTLDPALLSSPVHVDGAPIAEIEYTEIPAPADWKYNQFISVWLPRQHRQAVAGSATNSMIAAHLYSAIDSVSVYLVL